jgi:hypothetical protein
MLNKLLNCMATVLTVALVTVLLVPSIGFAQCPTNTLPTSCQSAGWAGNAQIGPLVVPGTGCQVTAQYCYVCCDGINYFYIYAMKPLGPDCNNVNPKDMQDAVVHALMLSTSLFGCDPCPNGETNTSITVPGCWLKNSAPAPWMFEGCVENGCYCYITATITCVDGNASISSCTSARFGDCNCVPNPGSSGTWPLNTCVSLECPEPCP